MRGELADALVRDEGECVEFKAEFTATRIGKTICAFANTKGGKIYIGVRDKKVKVMRQADRIVGISNTDEVIPSIKNIASDCKPDIPILTHKIPLDNTKKKNLSYFYPHASIQCVRFSGRDKAGRIVSKKEYNEDLISDVEKTLAFLNEHLNTAYEFPPDSMKRREVLEIHPLALREAVVNAVVHRDYWQKNNPQYAI